MSFVHSPKIITDGLVLALDAGNTKSYTSGSTTWFDKSGNANNGTLTNGPTFSSANGGSIVFDGVDDFWSSNCGYNIHGHTIMGFVNIDTLVGKDWICIFEFLNAGSVRTHYYVQGANNIYPSYVNGFGGNFVNNSGGANATWEDTNLVNVTSSQWMMLTGRVSGSFGDTFINLSKSKPTKTLTSYTSPVTVTTVRNNRNAGAGNTFFLNGRLSNVLLYNRALSDLEIQQNFNALRGRYRI